MAGVRQDLECDGEDVVERAQSNTRWLWMPQKGLDDIRDQAVSSWPLVL